MVYKFVEKESDTSLVPTEAVLDANSLASLIKNDDQAISKDLIEKAIEVSGDIKEIIYRNGITTIIIASNDENCIVCQMQKNQEKIVSKLKVGASISVKGIYKGVLMDAILLNCIVLNK